MGNIGGAPGCAPRSVPWPAPLGAKVVVKRLANAPFFALNEAFRLLGRRDRETQLVLTQSGARPTGVAAVVTEWEKVRASERNPPDFADAPSPIPKRRTELGHALDAVRHVFSIDRVLCISQIRNRTDDPAQRTHCLRSFRNLPIITMR